MESDFLPNFTNATATIVFLLDICFERRPPGGRLPPPPPPLRFFVFFIVNTVQIQFDILLSPCCIDDDYFN